MEKNIPCFVADGNAVVITHTIDDRGLYRHYLALMEAFGGGVKGAGKADNAYSAAKISPKEQPAQPPLYLFKARVPLDRFAVFAEVAYGRGPRNAIAA